MPLKPIEHDRRYGELDQVMRAYLGEPADDTAEKRSRALNAYLRHTWQTRPWAIAVAEHQLREYARNPPGRLRVRLGEYYTVPDVGLTDADVQGWLVCLADHLKHSIDNGEVPPPTVLPITHWEWHAHYPELAQLLGSWYSQDMPDEFDDHDAALQDYRATTHPGLVARLCGELHELLALPIDESDYAIALAELGMEVDPPAPYSPSGWLALIADRLTTEYPDYGPPSTTGG
ncbi:conserved hypothetical protein [Streptomyces himastatinicus ATCC 53653]|uniref:CdiI immunity protein domain-containing protein n=1 Tax=Streptomyces himastatinicus ATCC 53653 TaxID=457427 RepID=D9WMD7_9ACTN|nr:contact-dependent growth inhibition system immunity protein [Streptomyces himastatinicus]EFL25840.1 conserved hypothetical protein [Streptomyces himastatinicus ATCC 53653]